MKNRMKFVLGVAGLILSVSSVSAQSEMAEAQSDRNAFVFGGRYTSQYIEHALNPFTVAYENNYVLGLGYQQFFLGDDGGLKLGAELGAAIRMGNQTSTELWAGPVLRADGLIETDYVRISLSVTAGLSLTSDTIGIEAQRERETNGDTTLLYYLGPEISIASTDNPYLEFFWRLHHRSGGGGTLGGLRDGANATALGVRFKF